MSDPSALELVVGYLCCEEFGCWRLGITIKMQCNESSLSYQKVKLHDQFYGGKLCAECMLIHKANTASYMNYVTDNTNIPS